MKRRMSPEGQGRTKNASSDDFHPEDQSDSNMMRYTSTPLKKTTVNRLRRQSSAPNFDSEESTDVAKTRTKTKRRRSARSIRKERVSGPKIKDHDGADHGKKTKRKSRRRRSEGNNLEDDEDDGREENISHEQGREKAVELPIAELLRKAQENHKSHHQTRYEEPIPLPELTTDTLYVQGRNGFNAVKIGSYRSERSPSDRLVKPVHVAIRIHDLSKTVMIFCQGLLGGIALSQVVVGTKMNGDSNFPTSHPHLVSSIFLFLVTVSLLAAMDRIDLANFDLEHLREIFSHRFTMVVTFPLYLAALCIHLSSMKLGENVELMAEGQESGATGLDSQEEENRQRHTWKFSLCIIAWFLIAVGPNDDFTTTHLEAMQKYAN